jgi:hypothetical protein
MKDGRSLGSFADNEKAGMIIVVQLLNSVYEIIDSNLKEGSLMEDTLIILAKTQHKSCT